MNRRLLAISAACCAALLATTACGNDKTTVPAPTPRPPTATSPATRPAAPKAPTPAATPPRPAPSVTAIPLLTPPPGSRFERAPIDGAELLVEESHSVQYAVHITSGLPSGCHKFDHAALTRAGSEITIEVLNRVPDDPMLACTAIYGTHETTVQLGSDFASGAAYSVHINDRTVPIEFTAR